jgi:hypothetical protein
MVPIIGKSQWREILKTSDLVAVRIPDLGTPPGASDPLT